MASKAQILRLALVIVALLAPLCFSKHATKSPAVVKEMQLGAVRHWKMESINIERLSPNLLLLVLTNDHRSWGSNFPGAGRTAKSFINLVAETAYPVNRLSVGIMTSSEDAFGELTTLIASTEYARSHVIYHPGFGSSTHRRADRHHDSEQKGRRRTIARLRNYLMLRTLQNEEHLIWLDADVYWLSAGIIQQMIQQSRVWQNSDVEVGLITARCTQADNQNYDRNAWSGPRLKPTASQLVDSFIPQPTQETQFMDGLVKGTSDDDLVRLDSVGGTILYLKSEAVHQGLNFLTYAAVGTSWNSSEGWDGIETEGMCYVAKNLRYGCFGLGGTWLVKHTIF